MDNEEIQGVKFSEFQSATPGNNDEVVGLHSGNNARFSVANFILAVRQGIVNLFVPTSRTVNNKALSADITLDASDVGAYELPAGGIPATDLANGVIPTVPSISTATPQMDGTGAAGSTGEVSDAGHVHPSDTSKADETELAYVESGSTASRAYAVGEYFCWSGLLYRVKTAISSGDTFTPGTNCEQVAGGGFNGLVSTVGTDSTHMYVRRIGKMVFISYRGNVSPTAIVNTIETGLPTPDSAKSKTWQIQFMANISAVVYPAFATVNSSGGLDVSIVNNGAWATSGTYTCSFNLFYVAA